MEPTIDDVRVAQGVIAGVADGTPMVPSPWLSGVIGAPAWLKLESLQPIGAFKLRGALNAVAALPEGCAGVVACSSGNHGRGLAWAARERGLPAVICLSSLVPEVKVAAIRALGADVRVVGRSQDEAQEEVERAVAEEGLFEVPPFDDPAVIAGQGTIALEMLAARPEMEALVVPLSGGGLAAGIAMAAKAVSPGIRLIGVTMDRGAAMHASIRAGFPVDVDEVPTLADALGGGIGASNRLTLAMCSRLLDETLLVTEAEIYRAMQALYWEERLIAEGSCVVGLAAAMAGNLRLTGPTGFVISGRNVDMDLFTRVVTGQDVTLGALTLPGRPYKVEQTDQGDRHADQ